MPVKASSPFHSPSAGMRLRGPNRGTACFLAAYPPQSKLLPSVKAEPQESDESVSQLPDHFHLRDGPHGTSRTESTRDSGSAIVRFAGIPFTGQRANATPTFSGCGQATRVERLRGKPVLSGRVLSLPLSWNPSLSGLAWLRIFRCLQQI